MWGDTKDSDNVMSNPKLEHGLAFEFLQAKQIDDAPHLCV